MILLDIHMFKNGEDQAMKNVSFVEKKDITSRIVKNWKRM